MKDIIHLLLIMDLILLNIELFCLAVESYCCIRRKRS